ncbi:MAG: hypothetical protein IJQ30_05705 [Acidaminococcaceae bacterium]|nr:hypothetical protein [Acidaminococcaceae bacterium]
MAKINDIKNIIASAAAKNNMPTYENGNTALKVSEPVIPLPNNNIVPVAKPTTDVQQTQQQTLKAFIRSNLREGIDYGQIPGVKNNVLFKPGAAKIINFLRLRPQVELLHTVFDPEAKAISYTVKVALINEEGIVVTEALGASNTLEPKFAKAGMGSQNLVVSQAVKRATVSAVKNLIC